MERSFLDCVATLCFALAILHTFLVRQLQLLAHRYPSNSTAHHFFRLLGEVEVVFGVWAGIYLIVMMARDGVDSAVQYLEGQNFTEPTFVFIMMAVCSTKPILELAKHFITVVARLVPFSRPIAFYFTALTIGPLLGSFITEPAAMTVTALILLESYYQKNISQKLMYSTLGLLFVNISIGGTLTPYAAPPVLMVAEKWKWDLSFMFTHFGWKAIIGSAISTGFITFKYRTEISKTEEALLKKTKRARSPIWVILSHGLVLCLIVATAHHPVQFIGLFLFFLGLINVTCEYHNDFKLRESLLVGFFLAGLVILGGPQHWWLEPLLSKLSALPMYLGALGLTAITDNAALTYLGSQVLSLSQNSKYALVAGSVVGGGLTVIANAPNLAGFGILNPAFGEDGINPFKLFLSALAPTMISAMVFWFL